MNLAGLSIFRAGSDQLASGDPDLLWRHHHAAGLSAEAEAAGLFTRVSAVDAPDGILTHFEFGYGERVRCRFTVSAAGDQVDSWAAPEVSERDLDGLFSEHILRSVLIRRGLLSFHAAALSDGDGAILIMGDKGMGKSTLSAALQQRGWSAAADDLSRVAEAGGGWRTFEGLRATKLLAGSLAGLGLAQQALPTRWDDASEDLKGAVEEKRLLSPAGDLPSDPRAFRLRALLVLQPRIAGSDEVVARTAAPLGAVRALLDHITEDALHPGAAPAPALQQAIGRLVGQVPITEITLPDRIDALASSAEAVERIVRNAQARRAA
ncbi:MAG: hypothetical protein ACJ8DZ_06130 [Allosphingosinicella sp.]